MTGDQVSAMAKSLAHYLELVGTFSGNASVIAAAAALETLAANAAECALIAAGATTAAAAFQKIMDWLRGQGHTAGATALASTK